MQNNSAKRESVRQVILALLVSQNREISLTELDKDYKDEEGEHIPWKEFGHISLYDYLKSMQNHIKIISINGTYYVSGIASDKTKHISSLIARQKKGNSTRKVFKSSHYFPNTAPPKVHIPAEVLSDMICNIKQYPNGINKQYILKKLRSQCPTMRIFLKDLDDILQELSHSLYVQDNLIFPKESITNFSSDKYHLDNMSAIVTKLEDRFNYQNTDTTLRYCVSGDSDSEINTDNNDLTLVETNNINGNNENGTLNKKQPISMFIQETVSKSNQFNNTLIHDIEEIEHDNSKLYNNRVHTLAKNKCEGDITYLNEENAKLLISDRTKFRLEKLMQKYPNGIWCAELPIKYLEEYNISLNYIELGFNSVREFASCLPEIFCCKQLQPSGDYILYNANNELNDIIKKERRKFQNMCEMYSLSLQDDNELEALPIIVSPDTSNKLIPEGVMTMGETVGYISVTSLENGIQQYIEVFVEEVFTPSFFWVQLRKKRKLLNRLMEELDVFYQEKCILYKIPPVVLEKGLNCACIYDNQWHRGIIKEVTSNFQVLVMFYDYGTLKTYPPDAIYYLHRSFSYLPAQAIPCGLYNTRPCTSRSWPYIVTQIFALRIHQKPLIATIASTDSENNSMLVTLTDTMEEEDVHINDWLVHQNLAVHGKLVCMMCKNFPYCHYLQCKQNYKTNVKDLVSSNDLIQNSVSQHLSVNSNHVVSTSVNSNIENNFSSNNSKKDTNLLEKLENNFIANSYVNTPIELINFFERAVNIHKLRPNHKTKSNVTRLHDYPNLVDGNESKKELDNVETLSHTSSSVECDNSISAISENNCSEEISSKKEDNCSSEINCENNVITKQEKSKQKKCKNIPLLKKCFANAVNLSIDTESCCLDYSTLPDDNINFKRDNSKLVIRRNHKINFTNTKIEMPEKILLKLKRPNTSYKDMLENVTKSLDQVKVDFQLNMSCNNKTVTLDVQKYCNMTEINGNNIELNNELSNFIKSDNSLNIYNNSFVNLENIADGFNIPNTLMHISNTSMDNSKLDSDDLSNEIVNCNISTNETDIKSLNNTSNTNTNSSSERILDLIYNTNNQENNLVTVGNQLPSSSKRESKCLEQVGLNESLLEDIEETKDMKIKTFNDIDVESDNSEWAVEGNIQKFLKIIYPMFDNKFKK